FYKRPPPRATSSFCVQHPTCKHLQLSTSIATLSHCSPRIASKRWSDIMSRTTYNRHLQKHLNVRVRCPGCMEEMTLDEFYNDHAPKRHGLNKFRRCVFCFGKRPLIKGLRQENVRHKIECLKKFVDDTRIRTNDIEEIPCDTIIPMCEDPCRTSRLRPRDMCGRDRINELDDFYEPIFEKPEMWRMPDGVKFDARCGLGTDVYAIVKRYLKADLNWFHLMVKHNSFETFVREMTPIKDKFVVLSYGCLCDGLKDKYGQRQTHRHMIVACDQSGVFEKIWKEKVIYEFPKENGGYAKKSWQILNVHHLLRTMVYVSRPKASCDRGIPEDMKAGVGNFSHFHIFHPMSEHVIVFLCTLVPGVIETLLLEQNRNKNVVTWERFAVKVRDGESRYTKWAVPIGKTNWKFQNCVIPVEKQYEPTDEETDFYVYLYGNKRLYFKINSSLLDLSDDEWLAYQARKGNTFQSIREELYVLSPKQQNMMKQIKTMEEMMKTRINARWETKYSELQAEKGMMEKERDALKIELTVVKTELSEWKNLFKSELSEWKKVFMEQHSNTLGIIAAMIGRLIQNSSPT
ncbi:hypothetical protein AVEN_130546-1, partial [Araneus ventricosus]